MKKTYHTVVAATYYFNFDVEVDVNPEDDDDCGEEEARSKAIDMATDELNNTHHHYPDCVEVEDISE